MLRSLRQYSPGDKCLQLHGPVWVGAAAEVSYGLPHEHAA